jgi:CRISPR-associated protein (TIGR02710 family)
MQQVLLVCTVGGAPEPIVASILACDPARVVFVCSSDSKRSLKAHAGDPGGKGILAALEDRGKAFDSGRYEVIELASAQDLERCVETIHRGVTPEVDRWIRRGEGHDVVVDITGGTKCMTLALGLMTRIWPCRLQYVGGTERTKGGVGVVVSGREQIVHFQEPWNSLGYQVVDDARVVFDSGNPGAAAALAAARRNQAPGGPMKAALSAWTHLLDGFAHWERFDHGAAARSFRLFLAQRNLLAQLLTQAQVEALAVEGERALASLAGLEGNARASRAFVLDLLGNAHRRLSERRYCDSVARAYRAVEAIAQWRLADFHGIASTGAVSMEFVPEPLRTEWSAAAENGYLKLGLQDAYRLLESLGDPVGCRFESSELSAIPAEGPPKSPLTARNASYLAHGFQPAPETVAQALVDAALMLLEASIRDLPRFPKLQAIIGVGRQ